MYPVRELALDELELVRDMGPRSSLAVELVLAVMEDHLLDLIATEVLVCRMQEKKRKDGGR